MQVDSLLAVMAALQEQLETVDGELRRFARADELNHAGERDNPEKPLSERHRVANQTDGYRMICAFVRRDGSGQVPV